MAFEGFLTLNCQLEAIGEGRFRATTEGGARGPQSLDFELPFTPAARDAWLEQFREPFTPTPADRWRTLEQFGAALFNAVFQEENLATWRLLHTQARQDNLLLRVVLDITAEALQPLPWEALYDHTARFFLARDPHVCLLRYPRDPDLLLPVEPRLPLRILAVVSDPVGTVKLDVEEEIRLLEEALAPLFVSQEVELHWLDGREEPATLSRLSEVLLSAADAGHPFDVFHYIGHAGWNADQAEGVLLLENAQGRKAPTTASALGDLLRRGGLRLALLNACEGSREEEAAPFRSVAATLLGRADLPAVIANQVAISDSAAKSFASAFYRALSGHCTVEEAVVAAREAVAVANSFRPEWVATVFFSRFSDRPIRLLPLLPPPLDPAPPASQPMLTAALLMMLTTLMGVTVVSFFRVHGLLVGSAFQLGVWALAAWFAYDRWALVMRFRTYVLSALGLATAMVLTWFVLYQPLLRIPTPPSSFALALDSPSPFLFQSEQLPQVPLSIDVTGRVSQVPANHFVWILVQAENSGTYVAGAEALIAADGTFEAEDVIVGPPVPRPLGDQRYTLQPVLVDEAGRRFLQAHTSPFWRFFHPDIRVVPQPRLQNALVIRP